MSALSLRALSSVINLRESPLSLSISSVSMADLDVPQSKSRDLDKLLLRHGNLVDPGFVPGPEVNAFFLNRFFGFM